MDKKDERQLEERRRIEQELKGEIEDLDVGEGADEVVGGTISTCTGSCAL